MLHECLVTCRTRTSSTSGTTPACPTGRGRWTRFAASRSRSPLSRGARASSSISRLQHGHVRGPAAAPGGVVSAGRRRDPPEAHAAVQATRNAQIGLLATEGTVEAGRYDEFVAALDAGVELTALPCPGLVPLIESDDPFGAETDEAVREYAQPLKEAGVDTVILGCTHYPLIRPVFQRVFGRGVDARLLRGGDRARGGRDARPQGDRERRRRVRARTGS